MNYNRIGEKYITNQGYEVEIIEYYSCRNITIKFKNGFVLYNIHFSNLKKGGVSYPYHRSIYNIGYLGEGKYKSRNGKAYNLNYLKWQDMFYRCYGKYKGTHYSGCSIDPEWHNFQVFADWFQKNYNPDIMEGWHLDKDILVKGNKIYSPDNCCLVPSVINNLFVKSDIRRGNYPIGVSAVKSGRFRARLVKDKKEKAILHDTPEEAFFTYKDLKEFHIKEVANKYRGQITEQTYQALINYKVEITD